MDLAGIYDFVIEKGATFTRTIRWEDSSGVPLDISGYTFHMWIREYPSGELLASTEGTSPLITITKPEVTGVLVISIDSDDTATLDFNTAMYELTASTDATVTRVLKGMVKFDAIG